MDEAEMRDRLRLLTNRIITIHRKGNEGNDKFWKYLISNGGHNIGSDFENLVTEAKIIAAIFRNDKVVHTKQVDSKLFDNFVEFLDTVNGASIDSIVKYMCYDITNNYNKINTGIRTLFTDKIINDATAISAYDKMINALKVYCPDYLENERPHYRYVKKVVISFDKATILFKDQKNKNMVFRAFMAIYIDFAKKMTGKDYKLNPIDGRQLKNIIAKLRDIAEDKSDRGIIDYWQFILDKEKWDNFPSYYSYHIKVVEIYSGLVNILALIKKFENGETSDKGLSGNSQARNIGSASPEDYRKSSL